MMTLGIRPRLAAIAILGTLAACSRPPQEFNSPEEAAEALIAAAETYDKPKLRQILGSNGDVLISSPDTVSDRNAAAGFAAEARAQKRIELDSTKTVASLVVGEGDWPMPIPIVKQGEKWAFDPEWGTEELIIRRIGRNELDAIEVCRGYVEAQFMYSLEKHDGALVNQYAQRVISTPGKQDGLAWQAADSSWHGPIGERVARVIAEGYKGDIEPYHGYFFKILTGQGPAAPLGELDFMVDGAMIGGFALVAAPAEYRVTGVKTFIVSHDGIVYEKDFGDKTLETFRNMTRYNPDSTWKAIQNY